MQHRAVLFTGARSLVLGDTTAVEPGPGEVEIAPAYTGICGTDLHIFHGDMDHRVHAPMSIGHETSARVTRPGPGVEGWHVGQPVTVMPLLWDDTCPACQVGHQHLCHALDFIGIDSPGAMQSRMVVPAQTLVELPDELPLDIAALIEPTAVAVHDVRRAEVSEGERVLVVGCGPVGLLIAIVARSAGADVRVVETDPYRRSVAAGQRITALDPAADDVLAIVDRWTHGAGGDVSFEVSGSAAGADLSVASLRTRGRLCLVAIHSQPREIDLFRFFWRELRLIGARLYERADFERAVQLVASRQVPASDLISKIEPLGNAVQAFELLEQGGSVMKVLVDCQDLTKATADA